MQAAVGRLTAADLQMAIAPDALLATQHRRPAALIIPHHIAPDDCGATPAQTPVARPLFSCDSVQRQQAVQSRACVDQWLDVMEVSSKRSCSSATSISSLCSMDISTMHGASSSCSSGASLAAADCAALQQENSHLSAAAACPDLPPPAFVVLGLLS